MAVTRKRLELAATGEAQAADWYRRRGYKVLARNWRCPEGELDLVLRAPDGALVFSEVKSRSSGRFGIPAEAVTADKQQRVRALALRYLQAHPQATERSGAKGSAHGALRFDIVSILGGELKVLEGAF